MLALSQWLALMLTLGLESIHYSLLKAAIEVSAIKVGRIPLEVAPVAALLLTVVDLFIILGTPYLGILMERKFSQDPKIGSTDITAEFFAAAYIFWVVMIIAVAGYATPLGKTVEQLLVYLLLLIFVRGGLQLIVGIISVQVFMKVEARHK